jgi:diguanylate cyclase (GGDEF)-like protein
VILADLAGVAGLTDSTLVSQDGQYALVRGRVEGDAVLVRTHVSDLPTPEVRERLALERELLAVEHPHLVGVRKVVDGPARAALVLDDPGSTTLAEALWARTLDEGDLMTVGVQVVEALAVLHARRAVHGAVDADHVVLGEHGAVLVDLAAAGWAATAVRRAAPSRHPAPESGVADALLDPALDQYAVAAMLRQGFVDLGAEPSAELAAALDRATSPDPRSRHRSVLGLLRALRPHARPTRGPRTTPAPDSEALRLAWEDPVEVVGRDDVLDRIEAVVAGVAERGVAEVVVLRGAPGIGRTAVLEALADRLADAGTIHGLGRFEAFDDAQPLRTPLDVMERIIDQLLALPDGDLDAVRRRLGDDLREDLALAVQLVPALAAVVGEQPQPKALDPSAAMTRVEATLRRVVGAIASARPPLVALVDDVHRADQGTRRIQEAMAGHPDIGPLVTVLTAPSGPSEVDGTLERLHEQGRTVHEIELGPLGDAEIRRIVALGTGSPEPAVAPLADAVWRRSDGNPRVALADLWNLTGAGDLWVDVAAGRWTWSPRAVESQQPVTVEAEARRRVDALSPDLSELLVAVCLAGRVATPRLLAAWLGIEEDRFQERRDRATRARVLARPRSDSDIVSCVDDGVHAAVLAGLPDGERQRIEQGLAREVLAGGADDLDPAAAFEVVRLLADKPDVLDDPTIRADYVLLCERAAGIAHRAGAFEAALGLQWSAIAALGDDGWVDDRERMISLNLHAAEHALMTGKPEVVDALLEATAAHAPSSMDRSRVLRLVGTRAWTDQESLRGLDEVRAVLGQLGEPVPASPSWADVAREFVLARNALGRRTPESFLDAPPLADDRVRAVLNAMLAGVHLAYVDEPRTHMVLALRGTRLTARHGVAPASAYFLAAYGMLTLNLPGGVDRGVRFGQVATELAEGRGIDVEHLVRFAWNSFIRHWREGVDVTIEPLLAGARAATAEGRRGYGLAGGTFAVLHALLAGRPLRYVEAEAGGLAEEFERLGEGAFRQRVQVVRQAVSDLREPDSGPPLAGDLFDASAWLAARPRRGELAVVVHTVRGMVALARHDVDALASSVAAAAPLLRAAPGQAVVARHRFHAAVLGAVRVGEASGPVARARARRAAARSLRRLRTVAHHAPASAAYQVVFVESLLDAARGARGTTDRFEAAVTAATVSGAVHDLGVIAEHAVRFHAANDRPGLARHYATVAHDAWQAWGAGGLADTMPDRLAAAGDSLATIAVRPTAENEPGIGTLAEAGRLFGEELEVRDFLERLVEILLRHADATRAHLVLQHAGAPYVEVAAVRTGDDVDIVPDPSPDLLDHPDLCLPAVNLVLRTRRELNVVDPAEDRRLRGDADLRRRTPRALLALPLGRPGGAQGALILESDTMSSLHDPERTEAVRVLSAQAIAAVDHARTASDLSTLAGDVAELRATATDLATRAETDPLTGAANRHGLEALLPALIERAGDAGVGVLYCDLDDFKAVNDDRGHGAGDEVLCEVAKRLRQVVRTGDIVARVGGDEFIVVVGEVSSGELVALAERARAQIARPVTVAGGPVEVSASIGAAGLDLTGAPSTEDLGDLVRAADAAMYRAKRAGKDQVSTT